MGGSQAPGHTLAMYAQLLQRASRGLLRCLWAQLQSMRPAMPSAICMFMWQWTMPLRSVSTSSVGLWWSSRSLLVLHVHCPGQRATCCTGSCSNYSSPGIIKDFLQMTLSSSQDNDATAPRLGKCLEALMKCQFSSQPVFMYM